MGAINTNRDRAVGRLGAIGNQDWWHCRECGDVWATARDRNIRDGAAAAGEARLHAATHARLEARRPAPYRTPVFRPMSEKQR
jgi:hypothetical protein